MTLLLAPVVLLPPLHSPLLAAPRQQRQPGAFLGAPRQREVAERATF